VSAHVAAAVLETHDDFGSRKVRTQRQYALKNPNTTRRNTVSDIQTTSMTERGHVRYVAASSPRAFGRSSNWSVVDARY
jgi:hypothetical protein